MEKKLTDAEIEYINTKSPIYQNYGFVVNRAFVERVLMGDQIDIEYLKNSPYFIDKPVLTTSTPPIK